MTDKAVRKPLSKGVRFEVLKRDGYRCRYCGNTPADGVLLHVDHIVAVAEGGSNELSNLATACLPCNIGKGKKPHESPAPAPSLEDERERLEQMQEWTALQLELMERRDGLYARLEEAWEQRVGGYLPRNFDSHMRKPLGEFGAGRLVEAFDAVGQKGLRGESALRYFYGILRRWRGSPQKEAAKSPVVSPSPRAVLVAQRIMANKEARKARDEENIGGVIRDFALFAYGRPDELDEDYDSEYPDVFVRGLVLRITPAENGMLAWNVEDDPDWRLEDDPDDASIEPEYDLYCAIEKEPNLTAARKALQDLGRIRREASSFKRFVQGKPSRLKHTAEDDLRECRAELGWPNPEVK